MAKLKICYKHCLHCSLVSRAIEAQDGKDIIKYLSSPNNHNGVINHFILVADFLAKKPSSVCQRTNTDANLQTIFIIKHNLQQEVINNFMRWETFIK